MSARNIRLRFEDAPVRGRANDTVLTPPTPAELEAWAQRVAGLAAFNPGLVWTGVFKPALDAVPEGTRPAIAQLISEYIPSNWKVQPNGTVSSTGELSATRNAGPSNAFTGDRGGDAFFDRSRRNTANALDQIRTAVEKLWPGSSR